MFTLTPATTRFEKRKTDRRINERIQERIILFPYSGNMQEVEYSFSENISCGGICMISDKLFSPRDELAIELYLPLNIEKKVIIAEYVSGQVAWTERITLFQEGKSLNAFRIGIKFRDISAECQNIIKNYIEDTRLFDKEVLKISC